MIEDHLKQYVPFNSKVAIDVGANKGEWTEFLSSKFDLVHAVEPNKNVLFHIEQRNLLNVLIHNVALWSSNETKTFSFYRESELFRENQFTKHMDSPKLGEVKIQCCTGDSIFENSGIDFIKIDTEGAEWEVLQGFKNTLEASHPALIIEVHSVDNHQLIMNLLNSLNYVISIHRVPSSIYWIIAI